MEVDRQGKIIVNRFDTVRIDTRQYINLSPSETLYFGVYEFGRQFNECFIAKQATVDNPIVELTEEETKYPTGRYRYQIKVQNTSGDIRTIKGETLFEVRR